jgi:dTDP-4-amino-4,6-dideoxygalactose transaminase
MPGPMALAILTGNPAFREPLHVGRPNLGDRQRLFDRMRVMLDRNWLSNNGPYVQELERRIADITNVKHCIATCNATIALEIVSRAAGLEGEVIVPSFTFVATAHALQWQEITPVFCDVKPGTYHIDPYLVERMITPRSTGIIGVHVWGQPCDIDGLTAVAAKHGLALIFDAAHAFGCSYRGRMIGGFGLAEVFSFHATKFLNCFEGGAVVTNDDGLAAKIRLMKNFGFAGVDSVIYIGTNGKMTEVSALMGLTNLESMDAFLQANRRNYHQYRQELADIPGLHVIRYEESDRCNYQYIVVEVGDGNAPLTRDELIEVLRAENVLARRYFFPGCHRMQPYAAYFPHAGLLLPETERLVGRVIVLPTGATIGPEQVSTVCAVIRAAMEQAVTVRDRLREQQETGALVHEHGR